jgi:hypothetical protein
MKNSVYKICRTLIFLLLATAVTMCKKDDKEQPAPGGTMSFTIDHRVNGQALKQNELKYINAAGNHYMVTDLMYFISDITFYRSDGMKKMISAEREIFYVDENLPETKTIHFTDKIPVGTYDSISFVFGLSEEKNKSFLFVNPPEVLMGWPEILGGGYHYMMMNGKWEDTSGAVVPFNFHLGRGQLYHGTTFNTDSIYAFVPNFVSVHLPASSFSMADQETAVFNLTMNIEQWFENPHVYDHNHWGGAIMQNQAAMNTAKENGWNVFSIIKN